MINTVSITYLSVMLNIFIYILIIYLANCVYIPNYRKRNK